MPFLLSATDVRKALPIKDAIEAMRDAFAQLALGKTKMPLRIHMNTQEDDGDILVMPSYIPSTKMVGVKIVNIFKSNQAKGLPFIQGMVIIGDAETGVPLALMDGGSLTAIRTGAASGLATELLSRKDSKRVAVFGAGVQACTQLSAVCAVRDIEHVNVVDHFPETAERFAENCCRRHGMTATVASSSKEALEGTDIICASSTSTTPVFKDSEVEPGTHINAIGSFRPTVQEVPEEMVVRAKVVVDLKEMALAETGDLIIPIEKGLITADHIHGNLGDLVLGNIPGRESDEEITFFKSVGLAIQDLAAAAKVIENCGGGTIGCEFDFTK